MFQILQSKNYSNPVDKIQKLEPSLENLIIEENLQRELDEWFHRDETLKR